MKLKITHAATFSGMLYLPANAEAKNTTYEIIVITPYSRVSLTIGQALPSSTTVEPAPVPVNRKDGSERNVMKRCHGIISLKAPLAS